MVQFIWTRGSTYQSAKRSVYFPAPRIVFCMGAASASRFCRFDFWLRKSLNKNLSFFALRGPDTDLMCHQLLLIVFCHGDMTRYDVIRHRLTECRKFVHSGKGPDDSAKVIGSGPISRGNTLLLINFSTMTSVGRQSQVRSYDSR